MMRNICLLLCIVLLVSCQSTDAPTVSVTGSASVETHPDTLSFTLSAVYTGITTEEARSVTSGMIGYSTALLRDSFDVLEEDIHTEFFSISPSYTYKDGEEILNGQTAVQRVRVTLRDIEKAGDVIESLSKLDGIEIYNLQADKSDKSWEIMKARELAVHDAYAKASVYANASGYKIGKLISLSDEGLMNALDDTMVYAEMSSGSGTEYYSGVMDISDSVSAVFSLVE